MEQRVNAPAPWGEWKVPVCNLAWHFCQWQGVLGQKPKWPPSRGIPGHPPAPQDSFLGLRAAPERLTVILPVAAQPNGSVPLATAAQATPQPTPPQAAARTCPAPPSSPPARQEQQPLEKGPVQPEALSELVAAFGQCHQLQTALSQKQTALQEQGIALQAAMQELQLQLLPRPQQQQQPMPLEEGALQMAMQCALQQAVPLQQVGEEEELGSTSPLATGLGLQAMWPEGDGADSGNAGVASCSAAAYSGSAAAASGTAAVASDSAGAGSGMGPTADPWQCPEKKANVLKGEMAKAQEFFKGYIQTLDITVEHQADC